MLIRQKLAVNIAITTVIFTLIFTQEVIHAQSFTAMGFSDSDLFTLHVSPNGEYAVSYFTNDENRGKGSDLHVWHKDEITIINRAPNTTFREAVVSNNKVVAGTRRRNTPDGIKEIPFRWQNGNLTELPMLANSTGASVVDISKDGSIILGTSYMESGSVVTLWRHNEVDSIGCPPGESSCFARSLTAKGKIITMELGDNKFPSRSAIWNDGDWTIISPPSGYNHININGISPDGKVAGLGVSRFNEFNRLESQAYIWENGTMTRIDVPTWLDHGSGAGTVSDDGSVVLLRGIGAGDNEMPGFIWRRGKGIIAINSLLESSGLSLEGVDVDYDRFFVLGTAMSRDGRVFFGIGTFIHWTEVGDNWWDIEFKSYTTTLRFEQWPYEGNDDPEPKYLIVNSIADRPNSTFQDYEICDTGYTVEVDGEKVPECTLRAAIEALNNRASADSISFNIDGGGAHTITPGSPLPVALHSMVLDATTQPGYNGKPLITLEGTENIENGLVLDQGGSVIRGLSIGGFANAGIFITGAGENVVEACHIGVNASGTAAMPNRTGLIIDNSPDNRIGGSDPAQMNMISGNTDTRDGVKMSEERTGSGIIIQGADSKGNMVLGNRIGTDYSGQIAIGNGFVGVFIYNARQNHIGGDQASHGNLISGNAGYNVYIFGVQALENTIAGNIIGPNVDGTASLTNEAGGVGILFASRNRIGGATSTPGTAPGNLISGNSEGGVILAGINPEALPPDVEDVEVGLASENIIAGNLIGTTKDGTSALPNHTGVVAIYDAHKTQIGGDQAGYRNVISGNNKYGILLADTTGGLGPHETVIAGNYIGTSISGSEPLGNSGPGIMLSTLSPFPGDENGVVGVRIGGTTAASRNIVAGNAEKQIDIMGAMSAGTVIMNNYIGVLADGKPGQSPDHSEYGIFVKTNEVLIGSDHDLNRAPNVIGGNEYGIALAGNMNLVTVNKIGTNPEGTAAASNHTGVWVLGNSNLLLGNTISGNTNYGVQIGQQPDTDAFDGRFFDPAMTTILRNNIGTDAKAKKALGNGLGQEGAGVVFWRGRSLHMYLNVLSGNHHGVHIANSPSESGTRMAANFIGAGGLIPNEIEDVIALPEFVPIPNRGDGVHITNGRVFLTNKPEHELLEELALGNFIQNNIGAGVRRTGSNMSAALEITSNFFFGNTGLGIDLGPVGPGATGDFHEPPLLMQPVFADEYARLRGVSGVSGSLQIYTTPICHPSGYGEGRLHLSDHDRQVSAGQEFSADISLPGNLRVGFYITALLTNGNRTSEFSRCMRIASEEKYQEQRLDELAERTLELLRLTLELHEDESGGQSQQATGLLENTQALIYAVEFDLPADHNRFEGSALATDGLELTPNTIDTTLYWTLGAVGVPGIGYDLCVDTGGLPFMQDHEQHVLVHRSGIGSPWRPLDTITGADGALCASGLTRFGDIAIATYDDALPTSTDRDILVELPEMLVLWQNYPNPFNPATVIGFDLQAGGDVRLEVYDMLGRRIATLVDGYRQAGRHSVTFNAGSLSSGVYIYRITAGQFTATRRMTLLK